MMQTSGHGAWRKVFCMLALLFPVVSIAAGTNTVRILSSSGSSLTLEYIPSLNVPEPVLIDGQRYLRFSLPDQDYGTILPPGVPDLPERTVTVRLPGADGNTLEILQTSYEDLPGTRVAPVPSVPSVEGSGSHRFVPDRSAYGIDRFAPAAAAELRGVGSTRGAVLGTVAFHPVQFNPAAGTVRRYSRIVCRITFGPGAPAAPADDMTAGVAINDEQFARTSQPRTVSRTVALTNSVLSAGDWFRFTVSEDGMYKLTGQQLLSYGIPASTDPRTIKVYSNGGAELPDEPSAPAPDDLLPNAVWVQDGGTPGRLDPDDYLIFFGKSPRGWAYKPALKTFSHTLNHFSDVSYYWVTYGGSTATMMASIPSPAAGSPWRPGGVDARLFREEERVNLLNSGMEWFGQTLGPGEGVSYTEPLPGLDTSQPIRYFLHLAARSSQTSTMTVTEHGTRIATVGFNALFLDREYPYQIHEQFVQASLRPAFTGSQSQLRFQYISTNSSATGYIDWYEISYRRLLTAQSDVFHFHAPDTAAVAEYTVSNFSGAAALYDVTQFDRASIMTGVQMSAGRATFQVDLAPGTAREFYVVGPTGYKSPSGFTRIANQNLHGDTTAVDNIIVVHPDFLPAAQRLKTHRESPAGGTIRTAVVDVTQIYNEFGGGIASPAAIRNYLRYRYVNAARQPQFVLLFGDGNFDYKQILSVTPNWIPAWETPQSFEPLSSYPTDDFYAVLTAGQRVQLGAGRFTCRSLDEANTMVNKIIEYEAGVTADPWRLRTTFVADDGPQAPGWNDGFTHQQDAERSGRYVLPMFNKTKIYEYQYPTVITSTGRRKPDVNTAIVNQINDGTALLNFNGHGNPRLWTHEAVFVRETDFPKLRNKGKYFFLIAATCNYSNFDFLSEQSGGEILMAMADAGAIAIFSAARPVFQSSNSALNATLYEQMFQTDAAGKLQPIRLGTLVYRAKQRHFGENDRKFLLIGDPAMRIGFPKLTAQIDSINHQSAAAPVQLGALSTVAMKARVIDTAGAGGNFNGTALIEVFDAEKMVGVEDFKSFGGTLVREVDSFAVAGEVLFRGQASVTNGSIAANFIVPKDISYSGKPGKINFYVWNQTVDGGGATTNVRIGGTDSTAALDTEGPRIQLYLGSRAFHPGDVVPLDPSLIVDLQDDHGINTSGAGVGHRLEAWLDDATQSIDLSGAYRSAVDNYREGTISYPLTGLAEGTHRIKVRAWDTYNNSATAEAAFDVVSGAGLQINNVMNYPNPSAGPTIFTFEHNQPGSLEVTVRIYTVAGRLIQSLEPGLVSSPDRFVRIPWDGRDRDGSSLANGVYLYKVIVKSANARFSSEAYGKLTVLR